MRPRCHRSAPDSDTAHPLEYASLPAETQSPRQNAGPASQRGASNLRRALPKGSPDNFRFSNLVRLGRPAPRAPPSRSLIPRRPHRLLPPNRQVPRPQSRDHRTPARRVHAAPASKPALPCRAAPAAPHPENKRWALSVARGRSRPWTAALPYRARRHRRRATGTALGCERGNPAPRRTSETIVYLTLALLRTEVDISNTSLRVNHPALDRDVAREGPTASADNDEAERR